MGSPRSSCWYLGDPFGHDRLNLSGTRHAFSTHVFRSTTSVAPPGGCLCPRVGFRRRWPGVHSPAPPCPGRWGFSGCPLSPRALRAHGPAPGSAGTTGSEQRFPRCPVESSAPIAGPTYCPPEAELGLPRAAADGFFLEKRGSGGRGTPPTARGLLERASLQSVCVSVSRFRKLRRRLRTRPLALDPGPPMSA